MKITLGKGRILPIQRCAELYGWRVIMPDGDPGEMRSVCTDSREAEAGSLFAAIRGERVDGHNYISASHRLGCRWVLCERIPDGLEPDMALIVVDDTVRALNLLAGASLLGRRGKIIAITGSVGKTTTKEFVAAALGDRSVCRTVGNYNSTVGFPLSVMEMPEDFSLAVLEMGMSGRGEISMMSNAARPDVAIITNIGSSHLEKLGTRENIREAKYEITEHMSPDGILLLNGDDEFLCEYRTEVKSLTVGFAESCDVRICNVRTEGAKSTFDVSYRGENARDMVIPALGVHNVRAAAFGYAAARICGSTDGEIRVGLAGFVNPAMRQNIYGLGDITVIEDCYNASPESMAAALDVMRLIADERGSGRTVALLGNMLELGSSERELHERVGRHAGKVGLSALVTLGELAGYIADGAGVADTVRIENVNDVDAAAEALLSRLRGGDVLLVKASRGVAAERVIEILKGRI